MVAEMPQGEGHAWRSGSGSPKVAHEPWQQIGSLRESMGDENGEWFLHSP